MRSVFQRVQLLPPAESMTSANIPEDHLFSMSKVCFRPSATLVRGGVSKTSGRAIGRERGRTKFQYKLRLPCFLVCFREFVDLNVNLWVRVPYPRHIFPQEVATTAFGEPFTYKDRRSYRAPKWSFRCANVRVTLLTPTKTGRGALLRFCRIFERREGPGSGLGIESGRVARRVNEIDASLLFRIHNTRNVTLINILHSTNMDEDDTLVRRRSRRSTAGNRYEINNFRPPEQRMTSK